MSEDLAWMSAADLLSGYTDGRLSPVEVTQAVLARIEADQPRLNAFSLLDPELARTAARESEARWRAGTPLGRLDGVPTTIKDLLINRTWPTRRGSRTEVFPTTSDEDAPAVARLKAHGAVLLGQTTMPEFGWKGTTDSPLTGVTRNPWDPTKTPGGSSGGAAAAAAAGLGALHVGTDGGGSIRIPGAFTGTFGIKPTYGRVPAYPPSPFGTLAHLGPMARTVGDAALMLTVLSEPDPRDPNAMPYDGADFTQGLDAGVSGLRIGYSPALGGHWVDPEVAESVARAARALADLGATVEETEPDLPDCAEPFSSLWYAGAAHALRNLDAETRALMDPGLLRVVDAGAEVPLFDYLAAEKLRGAMGVAMARFHESWDLLLTPQMPIAAFEAGCDRPWDDGGFGWVDWTPFTYPFNMTRQPAATVPCGFTRAGLPVAFQLVGRMFDEATVLRAARAYEAAHPFVMPRAAVEAA